MKFFQNIKHKIILTLIKKNRKKYLKLPVNGESFIVPRNDLKGVETILYRPQNAELKSLPVLFNLHGGGWVAGDARLMDTFCKLMADSLPALIINVNYTKIDEQTFPYPIIELCDTVLYFAEHAEQYNIDKTKFVISGYSAGGHIAAGAAVRLNELGFTLSGQLLVYPLVEMTLGETKVESGENQNIEKSEREMIKAMEFLKKNFFASIDIKHRWLSPLLASDEELKGIAPAIIVTTRKDKFKSQCVTYANRLSELGTKVIHKEYLEAEHGFVEFSQPEYEGDKRRAPEQFEMAKDFEQYLIKEFNTFFT